MLDEDGRSYVSKGGKMSQPLLVVIFGIRKRSQNSQSGGYPAGPGEAGVPHPPPRPGLRKTNDATGFDETPDLLKAPVHPGPV
jgi:hypothetical protein